MKDSFVLMYGLAVDAFLRKRELYSATVLYEDLQNDPRAEISRLFNILVSTFLDTVKFMVISWLFSLIF